MLLLKQKNALMSPLIEKGDVRETEKEEERRGEEREEEKKQGERQRDGERKRKLDKGKMEESVSVEFLREISKTTFCVQTGKGAKEGKRT